VASSSRPWLLPLLSLICAGTLALALLSADQLSQYMPGAWFELLGVSVLILASLAVVSAIRRAWRRRREGLVRRGALWAGGAAVATLFGLVAIVGLIENAQIASVISGADVRLTKPVIESLPRPPGTKLLDQRPGLEDTESISQDISATDLNSIVPFYERELTKLGWVEDKTSAGTRIVRFTKGDFILSVAIDPPSSGYTLIVDRLPKTPTASPGISPSGP
jgi:4-amino-4-deoxy-L-arabinose transferase-like glycosyltransferase